jgi:hypothetical protein
MKNGFFLFICLIILTSCNKDKVKDNDIFTLTSEDMKGFSFESLKIIRDFTQVDFLVLAYQDETGKLISPFLSAPNLESRFALIDDFEDDEIAFQSFESFEIEDDYSFDILAVPVRTNQIWLIKTKTEKYGIILVTGSSFYEKKNGTPYAEISFRAKKI